MGQDCSEKHLLSNQTDSVDSPYRKTTGQCKFLAIARMRNYQAGISRINQISCLYWFYINHSLSFLDLEPDLKRPKFAGGKCPQLIGFTNSNQVDKSRKGDRLVSGTDFQMV